MGKIKTALRLLKNDPRKIKIALSENFAKAKISHLVPDKAFLKIRYKTLIGKKLDLNDPKTFNEKLQWLKLYDRNPEYVQMVDKYVGKKYVSDIIGEEYIIPTLEVWDNPEDINIDSLPSQFVLKCTHDSGSVIICRNKEEFDLDNAKKRLKKKLKQNMFWWGREWPYKNVTPRIIAEKYMEDKTAAELRDYKFMCFDGKVRCSFICSDRFSEAGLHVTFFDKDWMVMPFERHYPSHKTGFPKPHNYEKMIELAEKLSKGIPFVRVDFYEVEEKIYFGELTFYPGCGLEEFTPEEWDYKLGEWIKLPAEK